MAYDDESKEFVEARKTAQYDAEMGNLRENCLLCSHSVDIKVPRCNKLGMSVEAAGWCKFFV
jgi:hypothetical protein